MVEGGAASAGDVEKRQLTGQETPDGCLVGGVEHGPAGAAAPRHLIPQL
jgi:hypothetical protein